MQSFRDIVVSFEPFKDHVELNNCNFRAIASSVSMIVVFRLFATNNVAVISFALAAQLQLEQEVKAFCPSTKKYQSFCYHRILVLVDCFQVVFNCMIFFTVD